MTNTGIRSRAPLFIVISLSIIYFVSLFYMWHASNGLPGMKDQTESFTTYIAAKNFNEYGITNLSFLEDYATSPDPKAHPYYYTHNPDFPIYASYILIKMGFDDIRHHNFVAIFVLYAGLLFSYLFLKSRFSSTLALCVFGVSVFNYLGVLIFGLNIYRSFTWICVWGVLYFKHRWEESGAGWNLKLLWALLFMFMAVYFDYGVSGFIILITVFDKIFNWKRLSVGKLALYLSLSVIPSFALHLVSVISAIGWDTFSKDIMLTIGNRMYGFPSRDAIADFYRTNHIVLWGYNFKIDSGYLNYAIKLFYERVRTTVGYGTPQLAFFSLIAAVVIQARYFDRFNHIKEYRDEAKMLLTLFLAMFGVAMLLPAHFVQLYLHPFAPLVIFFVDFPRALLFAYAYRGIEHYKKDRISIVFKAAFAAGIAIVLFTQYRKLDYEKIRQMPASDVLPKYKGHTFYSNYLSTYTSYFTGNWSGTRWATISLGDDFFRKEYLFEADKTSGKDKYNSPDFVLCINSRNVMPCAVSEQFYNAYAVADEGDDYIIFDVRTRKAFPNVSTQWGEITAIERSGAFFPPAVAVSASSILEPNAPQNLLDDAPSTVWHRALNREAKNGADTRKRWGTLTQEATVVDWVDFDFGAGQKYAIDTLAARPNKSSLDQFFHNVSIKGSTDGKSWVDIAEGANPDVPDPDKWVTWRFNNTVKSRFYRVIIRDGFAGGQFYSLAELRLGSSRPR